MTKQYTTFLLTLSLVLLSRLGSAGGVTVGNGQDKVIIGFSIKNDFRSESELKLAAKEVIDSINEGSFERLHHIERQAQCEGDYRRVRSLKVESFLPIVDGVLTLEREYVGYLQVELKNCLNPTQLKDDEPFGGRDLWEF